MMDKTRLFGCTMKNFFGNSLLFSKADDVWKAKRKGLGHAFYKDKLIVLLETLKDYMLKECDQWKAEIQASPNSTTTMDMSTKIVSILQEFLLHIMIGSNLEHMRITVIDRKSPKEPYSAR